MPIKKIITILVIFMLLATQMPAGLTFAQSEEREPGVTEKICEPIKPDYEKLKGEWYKKDEPPTAAIIQQAFEDAQMTYHKYTECIFEVTERKILHMSPPTIGGTVQANTTNEEYLIDWLSPPAACLTKEELYRTLEETSPIAILPPLLEAHKNYSDYLTDEILPLYSEKGLEKDEKGNVLRGYDQLLTKSAALAKAERKFQNEIENSLIAIDIAFLSLKELRLAFVMHVQFQCMLNNLEKYRKLMEQIRIIVDGFPSRLRDASTN